MLFAADDFSTGVTQAMLELHEARAKLGEALRAGEPGPAPSVDLTVVRERVDVVHSRLPRVELLFGDETDAGKAAGSILSRLRATLTELGLGEYAGAKQQFELAQAHQGAFNREARRAMVGWRTVRS